MLHRCQKVVLFVQHSQYSLVNTGSIYFLSAIPIDPLERHFTEPQTAGGRGGGGGPCRPVPVRLKRDTMWTAMELHSHPKRNQLVCYGVLPASWTSARKNSLPKLTLAHPPRPNHNSKSIAIITVTRKAWNIFFYIHSKTICIPHSP